MLSKTSGYALRALIYLQSKSRQGKKAGVDEIAKNLNSPRAFTAKVLQKLTQASLISSSKGPAGGFYIADPEKKIFLLDTVLAIEGYNLFMTCGLGLSQCSATHPCPIHYEFEIIRNDFRDLLARITINDLAIKLDTGNAYLKSILI